MPASVPFAASGHIQLSTCRLLPKQSPTCRLLPMGRPAILHMRRHFGVAATATMEEYEGITATSGITETIEVDAAQVVDESLKIVNCNLQPETVKALEKKGIQALFPIQKSVFDPAMAGSDLVARARTGSGKTLAFSIPIIESIIKENKANNKGTGRRGPRALILAPTRELAKQVATELASATGKGHVDVCIVYGGTPIGAQVRQIERGIDVLVGTPGRVIDLVQNRRCASLIHLTMWAIV